jgi:hypothetical protein
MSSQTEICNMALAHFGQSRIIDINQTTGDGAVAAEACRDFWDNCRKSSLRAATWNFAMEPAELTASATAPLFYWAKQFPLPSDYIRMVRVNGRLSGTSISEHEIQGQMLLTNYAVAKIIYIKDVPLTGTWPEDFCLAFSYKLAGMVAPRLMADGGQAAVAMMQQHFAASLPALQSDKAESRPEVVNALSGSAYQAARCGPSPGEWYPRWGPGIPLEYGVQFNPWNVGP